MYIYIYIYIYVCVCVCVCDCGISVVSSCGATAKTGPKLPRLEASRSHAIRQARALGWNPVNERSARLRDHYVHCSQDTQETDLHALSRIRTRSPRNQAAANLCRRPHGYRDRRFVNCSSNFCYISLKVFYFIEWNNV